MIKLTPCELIVRGLWVRGCQFLHNELNGVRDGSVDPDETILVSREQVSYWFPGSSFSEI